MNRKVATIAIIIAFVGGMFFAGTPVEAKKGGGGDIIDEIWAEINALKDRVLQNESDISGHETRITSLETTPMPGFKITEEPGYGKGLLGSENYVIDVTENGEAHLRYEGCSEGITIGLSYTATGLTSNEGMSKFTIKEDRLFSTREPLDFDAGIKILWFEGLLPGEGVRFYPIVNCLVPDT